MICLVIGFKVSFRISGKACCILFLHPFGKEHEEKKQEQYDTQHDQEHLSLRQ